jgi:crotonobetainyl-CoA:carnitine CoA-transferase CaiB-like acyl-CoA transferase
MKSDAPLADVRVLAIEQYGAGPWGTLQLADLGAKVIKVEDPAFGGDVGRYVPPYRAEESSLFFETFNRSRANSAHQSMVPFQNFATGDGWVVVACPKQSLWERLCGAIERPELLEDGRFRTFALRDEHRDELLAELEPVFRSRPTTEWLEILSAADVLCAPVNDVAEALADVQVTAREAFG